jgi:hypothetical protein
VASRRPYSVGAAKWASSPFLGENSDDLRYLNGFATLNDSHGHAAKSINAVANSLRLV